jgi:hypothetical protein
MCKLVVPENVDKDQDFVFIPDKRSIKVESGNSLSDYLQTTLWFETTSKAKLINKPEESDGNYGLQFVDWVAHIVWANYERGMTEPFQVISPCIRMRCLCF